MKAGLVTVVLLSACTRRDDPTVPFPSPNPKPDASVSAQAGPSPGTEACPAQGGIETHSYLTDVRVAAQDGFDRVVFQFQPAKDVPPGIPKYALTEVSPPFTADPSDQPLEVEGSEFFQIIFHGGTGVDFSGEDYRLTYTGPKEIKPDLDVVAELQEQGDFEATLSWILGLQRPSCPTVKTFKDPLRLVIDLPH